MTEFQTLRPGTLVSARTRISGGVKYRKRDIEYAHTDENGNEVSRWDTTKIVFDPEEHKRASQVTKKARYAIAKLCVESEHGLLCPEERTDDLKAAIQEARAMCNLFNSGAVHTRIEVNVICGRVVADDLEATRAIFSETEKFLAQMQQGLKELDVKKVRALCSKALDVGQMLAPDAGSAVAAAVETARAECRKIVKAGEQVAIEIDQATLDTLKTVRSAFLDFEEYDVQIDTEAPVGRALDFEAAS